MDLVNLGGGGGGGGDGGSNVAVMITLPILPFQNFLVFLVKENLQRTKELLSVPHPQDLWKRQRKHFHN